VKRFNKIMMKYSIIIVIIVLFSLLIAKVIEERKEIVKEREFFDSQIVTIIKKEYKEPYTTTAVRPVIVGKSVTTQVYHVHHSAQYILYVKLDDGRVFKINTFELAYETVEIGKRYKYKDL
jgi:hypothetical protein